MLTDKIIGCVGAEILAKRISSSDKTEETKALFRLDKLSGSQIASISTAILSNPILSAEVELRIPEALVHGFGLPDEILISHHAGFVRNNVETTKSVILTANGNEQNLADTLGHVMAIGAKEMRSDAESWVTSALHTGALHLVHEDREILKAAITGLLASSELSLVQLGSFCSDIVIANSERGLAVRDAIGFSLPRVGLPKDTALFSNAKTFASIIKPWQVAFSKLFTQRAPLLKKLKQNGQPLDPDELKERLSENALFISDAAYQALNRFIEAPAGDLDAAFELSELEWEADGVYLVFDKPKEKSQGISDSTLRFLQHECDLESPLHPDDVKHLEDLKSRERRADFNEEDEAFFGKFKRTLEQDPKLHSRWEKALYGKPIECNDFFEGFIRVLHSLHAGLQDYNGERFLRFTVSKGRKEWRERFNYDTGSFFSVMYKGLKELMGSKIEWRIERMGNANLPDPLFDYEDFFEKEREIRGDKNNKLKPSHSISRQALQIKFDVALIQKFTDKENVLAKTQLLWSYKPSAIGLSMAADIRRLVDKGGIACSTEVSRRLVSKKGGIQSISIRDTNSFEAIFGRDAGSLIPATGKLRNLKTEINKRIQELAAEGRLTHREEIKTAWDTFEADYTLAMKDFIKTGLQGEAVMRQAESYSALLSTLMTYARGDICRSKLLAEVLTIGTTKVTGGNPAIIIPPWHPERMKSLAVKTRRVAGFALHLLSCDKILFGDREIFMREFSDELAHPFYPEITALNSFGIPILVSESDTVNGYSLMEAPTRENEEVMSDVDPLSAAKQARELLERYVGLQPHEASHLNIVLYNADAAELPLTTVKELASMQNDGNFQCSVTVRHSDQTKLRSIYGELVNKASEDSDMQALSEASGSFISKLRISVSPTTASNLSGTQGFKPFDIAFLHDVVARAARVEWLPVGWTNERPNLEHVPSRWSYRSVSGENELKSTTFLTCPWQTSSGWSYVSAVAAVCRQTDLQPNERFLPARRISLQDPSVATVIKDAHNLAEWVATYDELLDKKQLQHNNITVVRYRRGSTNGRNMIVSSTSELRLLSVLVKRRLAELNLDPQELQATTEKAKKDAISISGDIVLRAAKRGVSAGEMLGLVLSRFLLAEEFKLNANGNQNFSAYFLLDDYASWLSQPESRIADILALHVKEKDETIEISITIVESKYVGFDGLAKAKRDSKDQLLATMNMFRDAIFGNPGRLDRDIWLSRLSDLLIDAEIPPGMTALMERARTKLREGDIEMSLHGYSHIYIHSNDGTSNSISEQELLEDIDGFQAWQEVFGRHDLRRLVESYAKEKSALEVRIAAGPNQPWRNYTFKKPAPRATWFAETAQVFPETQTISDGLLLPPVSKASLSSDQPEDQLSLDLSIKKSEPYTMANEETGSSARVNDNTLATLVTSKLASKTTSDSERDDWAVDVTKKLKSALNSYGLQASVLGTRLTPNGCLVRLAGSDRLRIEDIENKRTQLLTTHALNLVTVQPKPGEIVVTIAGVKRQTVSLWELWARRDYNRNVAGINTSFLLGIQEINGALLYLNLGSEFGGLSSHEPHSLVAGATGSGKSVLIQALLLDISATNPKELAQIVLIDPKMGVDYAPLADLPHMREDIVTTKEQARKVLASLVDEMEERYKLFAKVRARDLATYNAKVMPNEMLPMVFLVHDEFADWMLDDGYKTAVGAAVQRLGVKARAAGIHLIFAAQRPDKDVMPMQLRENLGNRLILKVASEATSKISLDRPGAEMLLGRGHMAAKLNGEQGLLYAQAPFLSDDDIILAVEAICFDQNKQSS